MISLVRLEHHLGCHWHSISAGVDPFCVVLLPKGSGTHENGLTPGDRQPPSRTTAADDFKLAATLGSPFTAPRRDRSRRPHAVEITYIPYANSHTAKTRGGRDLVHAAVIPVQRHSTVRSAHACCSQNPANNVPHRSWGADPVCRYTNQPISRVAACPLGDQARC